MDDGRRVPHVYDDAELAAVNAAYEAMCDETQLPDDFDAAQTMAMAAIQAFDKYRSLASDGRMGTDQAGTGEGSDQVTGGARAHGGTADTDEARPAIKGFRPEDIAALEETEKRFDAAREERYA